MEILKLILSPIKDQDEKGIGFYLIYTPYSVQHRVPIYKILEYNEGFLVTMYYGETIWHPPTRWTPFANFTYWEGVLNNLSPYTKLNTLEEAYELCQKHWEQYIKSFLH